MILYADKIENSESSNGPVQPLSRSKSTFTLHMSQILVDAPEAVPSFVSRDCDLRRRGGGGGGVGGHPHGPQPKVRGCRSTCLFLPKRDGRRRHVTASRRTSSGGADYPPGHSGASLADVLQFLRASGELDPMGRAPIAMQLTLTIPDYEPHISIRLAPLPSQLASLCKRIGQITPAHMTRP